MRRIVCVTGLLLAFAAPAASARPAPPDPPPAPAVSHFIAQPSAPAPETASSSAATGDDGLSTVWIVVLAVAGAAVALGVGFARGGSTART